jgi:hypothetical protein
MAAFAGTATLALGATAAASASPPSLSGIFAAVPAARLLALALPLAAVGGFYTWQDSNPPTPTAQVVQAPRAKVPRALARPPELVPQVEEEFTPSTPETQALEIPNEPVRPSPVERSAPTAVEASKLGGEIRQEVMLLSKAQVALSKGRPQEALDALTEHASRFPRGALTEERSATRARTLCALGRRTEAEIVLARMEKVNPSSAYLARARESCGSR